MRPAKPVPEETKALYERYLAGIADHSNGRYAVKLFLRWLGEKKPLRDTLNDADLWYKAVAEYLDECSRVLKSNVTKVYTYHLKELTYHTDLWRFDPLDDVPVDKRAEVALILLEEYQERMNFHREFSQDTLRAAKKYIEYLRKYGVEGSLMSEKEFAYHSKRFVAEYREQASTRKVKVMTTGINRLGVVLGVRMPTNFLKRVLGEGS